LTTHKPTNPKRACRSTMHHSYRENHDHKGQVHS
jgi:hypothetical protein